MISVKAVSVFQFLFQLFPSKSENESKGPPLLGLEISAHKFDSIFGISDVDILWLDPIRFEIEKVFRKLAKSMGAPMLWGVTPAPLFFTIFRHFLA